MKNRDKKVGLYLMTDKGLAVLNALIEQIRADRIAFVISSKDSSVIYDAHEEIVALAKLHGIPVYSRSETPLDFSGLLIAVSWRWLIKSTENQTIVVFHDSLLPRYRGFAPLVTALINGEDVLGVTALVASDEYDKGEIIDQASVKINYPITIDEAIKILLPCYQELAVRTVEKLLEGNFFSRTQVEHEASYSLWLDADDYFIDWTWDAEKIKRFVDAVGFPYQGAATKLNSETFRILKCVVCEDVRIENRIAGKVIFIEENNPVIVCGKGLIKILEMIEDVSKETALPLKKFRSRFH